ncbi:hypothetical protein HNQ77_002030 [Silvibacterium bohemicum]|uniref:Glycosyltransferase RgtA/B/C/D-like domain-containing protein n=1 Tax=Silvibacterium bohemicum TaxID=1577686 RepID=A0A841K093_9BACT|nr:hypothetical protein [Silvibacterium bohemicum]MBB6144078.1 hypothetical protein [Silvibacterium bohemicum]
MNERAGKWCGAIYVAIVSTVALFFRFRFGGDFLAFYEDDFFYYLKVAQNIAAHGVSTFDGIHLTNGYHPLWMVVMVGAFKIAPSGGFYLLQAISVLSVLCVYWFSYLCLRMEQDWIKSLSGAVLLATFSVVLASTGMEVILTLPLVLLWIWYRLRPEFQWTNAQVVVWALLGSLVVLSRLDAAFLILLVFVLDGLGQRFTLRQWVERGGIYTLGSWLVVVYLALNIWIFHSATPVSGKAKQLRWHHWPSLSSIKSFFFPLTERIHIELSVPGTIAAICVLMLLVVPALGNRSPKRFLFFGLTAFPFFYIFLLSCLTDWPNGGWSWYDYIFVFPIFSFMFLFRWPGKRVFAALAVAMVLLLNTAIAAKLLTQVPEPGGVAKQGSYGVYATGKWLAEFSQSHPGNYAIGDRAGAPGYLMHEPVMQLEGLMMDAQYLKVLRTQRDLNQVLRDYDIRYYVSTNAKLDNGCYVTSEPAKAGKDSPKMTGRFCSAPIGSYRYFSPGKSGGAFTTLVFDLRREAALRRPAN